MNWSYADLMEAPDSMVGEIIEIIHEENQRRAH